MYLFLQSVQSIWKDDYAANQLLRNKFRQEKREWKAQEMKDDELRERAGLDLVLLPERQEDIELASRIKYHGEGRSNYLYSQKDISLPVYTSVGHECKNTTRTN